MMMPVKKDDHLKNSSSPQPGEQTSQKCKLLAVHLRAGMTCPYCHQAELDYNGMLQLVCPLCGVLETGTFT
jgi:hypothetical protein